MNQSKKKKKRMNQVTMIQIVSKKQWVSHEFQGTDMSSTNKELLFTIQKRGVVWIEKNDLKESLRRKISLGKTCSLFRQEYSE